MNEIDNLGIEKAVSSRVHNLDDAILVLRTAPTDESTQKEEGKHSTILSNDDKSYESKDQSNEIQLELLKAKDGDSYLENKSPLLKKKRNRTSKEILLDMDHLRTIIFPNDKEEPMIHQLKTKSSNLPQKRNRLHMSYASNSKRRKQKLTSLNKQCHICNSKASFTQLKSCSIKSCSLLFCYNCLIKYKETEDSQLENSIYNNNWKCLKCRNLCKCHRCRVGHRKGDKALVCQIPTPREPIDLKSVIQISDLLNDPIRQMNNIIVGNFVICEINNEMETDNIDYYYNCNDLDDEQAINSLTPREVQKLNEIYQLCEIYNLSLYSSGIEKDKSNKTISCCIRCLLIDCNLNELLCFLTKKDLMFYLKYSFLYQSKILRLNHKAFARNKRDLLSINQNSFLSKWKFFHPKVICKSCFMYLLNMNNMVANLKIIFNDDNVISLPPQPVFNNNESNDKGGKDDDTGKKVKRKYTKRKGLNKVDNEKQKDADVFPVLETEFQMQTKPKEYNTSVTLGNEKDSLIIKKNILNFSFEKEMVFLQINKNTYDSNNQSKTNQTANIINKIKDNKRTIETKSNQENNSLSFNYITDSDYFELLNYYSEINNQVQNFKLFLNQTKQLIFIQSNSFPNEMITHIENFMQILNQLQSNIQKLQKKAVSMKNFLINEWAFQEEYSNKKKKHIHQLSEIEIFCSNNYKESFEYSSMLIQLCKVYYEGFNVNNWYYYINQQNQNQ